MYSLNRGFFCILWYLEICKHSHSLFIHPDTEKLVSRSQAPSRRRLVVFTKVVIQYQVAGARIKTVPDPLSPTLSGQWCAIHAVITCLSPQQRLPL